MHTINVPEREQNILFIFLSRLMNIFVIVNGEWQGWGMCQHVRYRHIMGA
jgi:hypothetical protein